ncbi:MAG: LLM class flavin-dependent oxidoreductase [Acidimicrobiales bacterium]
MTVRFSLSLPRYVDPEAPDPLAATYDFANMLEELGYYAGYVGHHSFTPETRDPSAPFSFLSALAARTEKLRLGTGIFLAGLHEPVATCEHASTLDVISGGRSILGVAAGYREYEFEGHHVPFDERGPRLDEQLEIIRSAWTTGRYGYEGQHYSLPDLPVYPTPIQDPHPPILVGGTSPPALRRAARYGDGWFTLPMETLPVVKQLAENYRAECAAVGKEPYICLMREAWVSPTRAGVEEDWLGRAFKFHRYYWETGTKGDEHDPVLQRVGGGEDVDLGTFIHDRAIAGTPEACVAELERWHDAIGFDELCLLFLVRPRPWQQLDDSVSLFATEVIPEFQARIAGSL